MDAYKEMKKLCAVRYKDGKVKITDNVTDDDNIVAKDYFGKRFADVGYIHKDLIEEIEISIQNFTNIDEKVRSVIEG